jgi:hypothetical protein
MSDKLFFSCIYTIITENVILIFASIFMVPATTSDKGKFRVIILPFTLQCNSIHTGSVTLISTDVTEGNKIFKVDRENKVRRRRSSD